MGARRGDAAGTPDLVVHSARQHMGGGGGGARAEQVGSLVGSEMGSSVCFHFYFFKRFTETDKATALVDPALTVIFD